MKKLIKFNPFLVYSTQLSTLFDAAKASDNPAFYLYKNGARNVIFMLEGLTRIHKNAFDNPKMEKWYDRFKELEDLLGQIDYFDVSKNQLENDKVLTAKDIEATKDKTEKFVLRLNILLKVDNWLDGKLLKFDAFILKNEFKYDAKYIKAIVKAYKKEITKITDFATELHGELEEVETELHEFRRKFRWLSIYPQAFNGLFQFQKPAVNPDWSAKYMSEQIVNSPFNKLPKAPEKLPIIHLNYPNFIALSFIIQEFGKLKDKGLQAEFLAHELHKSAADIPTLLGDNYIDTKTILATASQLLKTFFNDKVFDNLIL
ncbi:MAG: hypothetical protein U5L45_02120 [Saprospiraceae bacterium]|nr:hypothetical protein [Saprospiraceae bacterium]